MFRMDSHKLSCSQVQISAYLDNVFDVAALMEDSETKTAALEKVAELEDELGHVSDTQYIIPPGSFRATAWEKSPK